MPDRPSARSTAGGVAVRQALDPRLASLGPVHIATRDREHVYVSTAQGLVRAAARGDDPSPTVLPTGDPAIGRPALDPVSWTVYVQARRKADRIDVVAIQP